MRYIFTVLITVMMILGGCGSEQDRHTGEQENGVDMTKLASSPTIEQHVADRAKDILKEADQLKQVVAVNTEKKLVVGATIRQSSRFKLRKLRKEWTEKLQKKISSVDVYVSLDQKIIWKLDKLEEKMQDENIQPEPIREELNYIIKLMKKKT